MKNSRLLRPFYGLSFITNSKRWSGFLGMFLSCLYVSAQGVKITAIGKRSSEAFLDRGILSWKIGDTSELPFYDDFTSTTGYPDQQRWTGIQAWVNNTFAKDPPNYNVATLEHLNPKGNPYGGLSKNEYTYADSLTSVHLNLRTRKNGSNLINYKSSDSLILSFFYQQGGWGDVPESDDSLILFFKDRSNNWRRVWAINGGKFNDFSQVFVTVDSALFFYKGFQFRFVNYTHKSGNLNHWNIDMVRLASSRKSNENAIEELGIVEVKRSLLKKYFEMPYDHFKTNYSALFDGTPDVKVNNMFSTAVQVRFGFRTYNRFGKRLDSQSVGSITLNIPAETKQWVSLAGTTSWDTFSTADPSVLMKYQVVPQSNDRVAIDNDALGDNNLLTIRQRFMPWYAYDDGSAEGGIYLDYGGIPPTLASQFAIKYSLVKADSIRGLAVYFNQSNDDVRARSFKLRIWQTITPSPGTDKLDKLYYSVDIPKPAYTDSINGYHFYMFDTAILLPAGDFYVGWQQPQSFNLNIGYDNNYRYEGQDVRNPYLYQDFNGVWDKVGASVMGAPMIRPLIGSERAFYFNTPSVSNNIKIKLYPNPAAEYFKIETIQNVEKVMLFSTAGVLAFESKQQLQYNISELKPGYYTVAIKLQDGNWVKSIIIKY